MAGLQLRSRPGATGEMNRFDRVAYPDLQMIARGTVAISTASKMTRSFSITQAKRRLSRIVRSAEADGAVALTRRGTPVAILMSTAEYDRLRRHKRPIDWGAIVIDTRGFRFDRDEANAR